MLALWVSAGAFGRGQATADLPATSPDRVAQVNADYALSLRRSVNGRLLFESPRGGTATVLVLGLQRGGAVGIRVNGAAPLSVELQTRDLAEPILPPTVLVKPLSSEPAVPLRADSALVSTLVRPGKNEVEVSETDGVQVVRVVGTNRWFATSTQSAGYPLFWVDFDGMVALKAHLSARVHYGPAWDGFLWFGGRWDQYWGEVYVELVTGARGTSGQDAATLSYTTEYPRRQLTMPTQLTFTPEPATGALAIRVRQSLRALGETTCGSCLQFLHVKVTADGDQDWGDGAIDYAWYRSQSGDSPDAAPGSHTGMVRIADYTLRRFAYRSSVNDPQKTAISDIRHTATGVPLAARNTIGGFISKAGVGSCGWVFHEYGASFRTDLTPVYSHCGAGADTHFYATWAEFFNPLTMKAGDRITADYSLTMLPSEVRREEIEDLNEADLHFFGNEKEQNVPVAGWIGTRNAIGLRRADGSLILLGLGREPAQVPLPAGTMARAVSAYRLFALSEPTYDCLDLGQGTAEVRPGWITLVDCGAALWEPTPVYNGDPAPLPNEPATAAGEGQGGAGRKSWPQPPAGGPFQGMLRRK